MLWREKKKAAENTKINLNKNKMVFLVRYRRSALIHSEHSAFSAVARADNHCKIQKNERTVNTWTHFKSWSQSETILKICFLSTNFVFTNFFFSFLFFGFQYFCSAFLFNFSRIFPQWRLLLNANAHKQIKRIIKHWISLY